MEKFETQMKSIDVPKMKRIYKIMDFLGMKTDSEFLKLINFKSQNFSNIKNGTRPLGNDLFYKILLNVPKINPRWLEYGEEPMTIDYEALKNESITKESQNESIKNKQETIDAQKVTINSLQKIVSTLEVRICELENQLQEARHALKNTVGAD